MSRRRALDSRAMPPAPRGPWAVGALILACVLGGGLLHLGQLRSDVRRHAAEHLDAVADLKVRLVANWREERLADAFSIGANPLVARAASQARSGSAEAREDLLEWCRSWLQHREYRTVAVFDAGGKLLAFAGPPPADVPVHDVMGPGKTVLSDLHDDAAGVAHADLYVPLFLSAPRGPRQVGLAMMRAEPADRLFPLLEPWPTPSHTGQVLLVRRSGETAQVLFVARHPGSAPVPAEHPLTRADLPAVRAARGEYGLADGVDPQGRRVMATARPIPGTTWSLVAHMDGEEIYAPLRERVRWVLLLCAALAGVAATGALLWWRRQLERFRDGQREAELERMALERHFSHLSSHTNDILLLADGGLRIVDANDRAVSAYGYGREELLGKRLQDILAPRARVGFDSRLRAIAAGQGEVLETLHLRRDGTLFPVEASSRVIEVEGERYYQKVIRDITERKSAERALRRSEDRLRLALEVSGLGIWDWDIRRDELYLSPTLLQMLGYLREELQGGDVIRRLFHPEDRAAASGKWESLLDGGELHFEAEMRILARSGDWRWVLNRARVVERDRAKRPVRVIGALIHLTGRV